MEREAAKLNRTVDLLPQVHIAAESTKFGFSPEELRDPHDLRCGRRTRA